MTRLTLAPAIMALTLHVGCATDREAVPFAERTLDIAPVAYDLAMTVDFEELLIRGSGTLTVRNISTHAVDHIPLLLYRMMKVTALTGPDGDSVPFTQRILPFDDWEQLQVNYVEVEDPLDAGTETTLAITWQGYLNGYTEAMRYVRDHIDPAYTVIREETKAYPVVGYPSGLVNRLAGFPEFDLEARVTVPESLVVAYGGELLGVERDGGQATYHYRSTRPAWRVDIAIAPYTVIEDGGLTVFAFPADRRGAETVSGVFRRAMEQYTAWFGPLHDFAGYTIIEIPDGYGSQAAVNNILLQAAAFRTPDELIQLYHEASHLWNVQLTDRPSPRWDEGLATFHQALLVDQFAGDTNGRAVEELAARIRDRLRARFEREPRLAAIPPVEYGTEDVTDLSYRVGMLMFGVLHHLIGSEALNALIGGFYQEHHATGASTADFVARADAIAPMDLAPFFQDWLYGTGYTRFLSGQLTLAEMADTYR